MLRKVNLALKNNQGVAMVLAVMILGVVTVLMAGIYAKLSYTNNFSAKRTTQQQLHLDAQSALGVITNELLKQDPDPNDSTDIGRELLKVYAKQAKNTNTPVTANFKYSGNNDLNIKASISSYDDTHAKITVEATDRITGEKSSVFQIVSVESTERNSIFDNMFIVYHPDKSNGLLSSNNAGGRTFNGGMMVDNKARMAIKYSDIKDDVENGEFTNDPGIGFYYPKYIGNDDDGTTNASNVYKDTDALNFTNMPPERVTTYGSIISNGTINIGSGSNATVKFVDNAMIASPVGKVSINGVKLEGDLKLIASAGKDPNDPNAPTDSDYTGIHATNVTFATERLVNVLTRDSGVIELTNVNGNTVENIYAGGALTAANSNIGVEDGIYGYKKITLNSGNYSAENIYSNQDFSSTGNVNVDDSVYATTKVKANKLNVGGNVLAGGMVDFSANTGSVGGSVLGGANFNLGSSERGLKNVKSGSVGGKIVNANSDSCNVTDFETLNLAWRAGVQYCAKGGFDGTSTTNSTKANILVALTGAETNAVTKNYDNLSKAMQAHNSAKTSGIATGINNTYWALKGYKVGGQNVAVSADLPYSNDDNKLMLRTALCDWIGGPVNSADTSVYSDGAIMSLYNDAISTDGIPPMVEDQLTKPLNNVSASVSVISENGGQITELEFLSGGKLVFDGGGDNLWIEANYDGAIARKRISKNAKFTFNTSKSGGRCFDLYLTTKNDDHTILFPWSVEIKYDYVPYATARTETYTDDAGITWKAAGSENYVAIFLGADDKIMFKNDGGVSSGIIGKPSNGMVNPITKFEYVAKRNADGTCEYATREYVSMPEFYVLSPRESFTTLSGADSHLKKNESEAIRIENYDFNGFIVAPRSYVFINEASSYIPNSGSEDAKEVFKGVVMCKDIMLSGDMGAVYNYYFPLSYHNVLNTDNFKTFTRHSGSN